VNVMEVINNDWIEEKNIPGRVMVDESTLKNNAVNYGDVLFNRTSETREEIGLTSAYFGKEPVIFGGFVIRGKQKNKILDPHYLKYCFSPTYFRRQIIGMGQGAVRVNIGQGDLSKVELQFPPLPEQKRIVSVLETWDQTIDILEKKIELKEQLKKGLMQQLLTGKKRLPGFSGEWKNVILNELCSILTGKKDVNEGNPMGQYPFFTCARQHTYSDNYSFDTEAILIAGNADVGHCKYFKGKFEAYQRTYVLSSFKDIQPLYLFRYLSHYFKNYVESMKQIGAMSYMKLPMLKEFQVKVPHKDEQIAIAKLLAKSEKEIKLLKIKLESYKKQKTHLLNNLVAGKIRTPEDMKIYT